jgi:hypothetical protein
MDHALTLHDICTSIGGKEEAPGRSGVQITNNTQSLRMFPDPILPYMFIYLLSRAERLGQVRHKHMKLLWSRYTCPSYTRSRSSQTTCINNPVPCSSSLLAYSIAGLLVSRITLHYSSLAGRKEA